LGAAIIQGILFCMDGVVSAFERIMRAHKGEVDVIVTSAQPLEGNVLRRLEQSISKSPLISKGQRVKMQNKVHFLVGGATPNSFVSTLIPPIRSFNIPTTTTILPAPFRDIY